MNDSVLNQLLNSRINLDTWDFQVMIEDVKSFLEIAENNLSVLHAKEIASIKKTHEDGGFSDIPRGYKEHLEQNSNFRFLTSQPLQIRYAALVSLTTSVEWAIKHICKKLEEPIKTNVNDGNKTVQILSKLNNKLCLGLEDIVLEYGSLVKIRNCIVHNSGIKKGYRHEEDLPKIIEQIRGISLEDKRILGVQIWIEKNSLNRYIDRIKNLVIKIYEHSY